MPAFEAASPLLVMIVFFGQLPPWLPLTLHSMAANERVRFVVVSDAVPPAVLPPNVAFEHITYEAMQARLSGMTGMQVAYPNTYKANDIKPLLPALYPKLVEGYRWWAWADLDVVFGDLMRYFQLAEPHPACCKGLELTCNKKARRDRRSPCFNSTRPVRASSRCAQPVTAWTHAAGSLAPARRVGSARRRTRIGTSVRVLAPTARPSRRSAHCTPIHGAKSAGVPLLLSELTWALSFSDGRRGGESCSRTQRTRISTSGGGRSRARGTRRWVR